MEELAVNYDQKSQEVEAKNRDNETVNEELSQRQSQLNSTLSELAQVRIHQSFCQFYLAFAYTSSIFLLGARHCRSSTSEVKRFVD